MHKPFQGLGFSFDLDGTLYPVSRLRIAWRLRRQLKLVRALAQAREAIRKEPAFENEQELAMREAELISASLKVELDTILNGLPELKHALADAASRGRRPFPGVIDVLQWAHEAGAKLAVFSDYDPKLKLKNLGLEAIPWSICLGADACGALKPHKRGFERIREAFGLEANQILHIGDRLDCDISGAVGAGFQPVLYGPEEALNSSVKGLQVLKVWAKSDFEKLIGAQEP